MSLALGELADDTLANAWVADVLATDPSHLRVIVVTRRAEEVDAVHEVLQRSAGRLRSEVASAITRKRVPLLAFEVHGEEAS